MFFGATITAVMCSHALPAIGNTMIARKACGRPVVALNASMAPQMYLGQGGSRYWGLLGREKRD